MADPFGSNITERAASIADSADPNFANTELATRVRQLRVDLDAVDAGAASTTAVLAALAAADGNVDINSQDIRNAKDIVSHASENLVVKSANEVKIQTSNTDRIRILADGKIGFFGETPVAQQADLAGAAFTDNGTPSGANALVAAADQTAIDNNFATVAVALNEIRTALRNLGLMA